MAINNEIEFKQIINESIYQQIQAKYFASVKPFKQVNYYIDTPDFLLKSHHSALRIRVKKNEYEMTLKVPAEVGLTEYNHTVSIDPHLDMTLDNNQLPQDIRDIVVNQFGAEDGTLTILGALTTYRMETNYHDDLLVLDKSEYLGQTDYELEFEVQDHDKGLNSFNRLLSEFNLTHQPPLNKVQRFFNQKAQQSSNR